MDEVRGQLAVGILADVLRHAAFLRESGRIDVSSERNRGWVVVRDGRPVHAVCRRPDGGPAHGLEALSTMLSWSEGTYGFEPELPGPAGVADSLPADAFLVDEDDPPTLSGDTETVLKEARAYSGHRNGRITHARPRYVPLSSAGADRPTTERSKGSIADAFAPSDGESAAGEGLPVGTAPGTFGDGAPVPGVDPSPRAASGGSASAFGAVAPAERPDAGAAPAIASRLRPSSVLTRSEDSDPESRVTVSRGALDLWLHVDGVTPLGGWSEELAQDGSVLERRAGELIRAGLAVAEPEPVYGSDFVSGLTDALNDIMGPMGEIVVQDALAELDLDPTCIALDRVDELASALASHLHRSDWQLKLRARVARLRAETMEMRTEASP